jgi:hypothetical protein
MAISVIVMPGMESGLLTAGAAQDGPTPLRNSPSTRPKAVICRPKNRANIRRILQVRPSWINEVGDQPDQLLMAE